ncbi:MAG: bifunctional glutamate N-acetyltransferase/amino-acid acetyltransferase ArgJ [Chloroflexi bacterium]|nr:bifunctional glutamate N-acetyltransferase/amino-acid acetyltransferase ArgJ [Chloroflexota bacterium]
MVQEARSAARLFEVVPDSNVTSPAGFVAGAVYAGIKTPGPGKLDLSVLWSERPCTAAGLFTTNLVRAPVVAVCEQHLRSGKARGVVVNAGCANACTGEEGRRNAETVTAWASALVGAESEAMLAASTGVIGHQLPMEKIQAGMAELRLSPTGGAEFARAIITTDSHPKTLAVRFEADGRAVTVAGAAKGAGMIHPNMATMLAFITTDAAVAAADLQAMLRRSADRSFNAITIDGDTSTNDTLLALANGATGVAITPGTPAAAAFQAGLDHVCQTLARQVARDGEGATRLMEVRVEGARTDEDAGRHARTVAGSMLVKSAVHGADPNWGRILAAMGRSGAYLEEPSVDLWVGDVQVMAGGRPLAFDEALASAHLKGENVLIRAQLNLGTGTGIAWGCDLSEEYVTFNSDYTT